MDHSFLLIKSFIYLFDRTERKRYMHWYSNSQEIQSKCPTMHISRTRQCSVLKKEEGGVGSKHYSILISKYVYMSKSNFMIVAHNTILQIIFILTNYRSMKWDIDLDIMTFFVNAIECFLINSSETILV